MPDGVASALIGAFSATVIVFLTNAMTIQRDNKAKRLQIAIDHAEKQISQFYSPLAELVEELDAFASVKPLVTEQNDLERGETTRKLSSAMYDQFFLPTHEKIVGVLRDKMHLVEGWDIPTSFTDFLRHYTGQKVEAALKTMDLHASFSVEDYPSQFYGDIRNGLIAVSKRYESYTQEAQIGVLRRSSRLALSNLLKLPMPTKRNRTEEKLGAS